MRQCPACLREYDDAFGACPHDGTALRADPLVGTVVDGKYRVDAFIGKGAMGGVYRATQLALDRPVAVKVMLGSFLERPEILERFRREAMAVARLRHPNVITVYDYGVASGAGAYLAMELLEGRSLRGELTGHRLDPDLAADWMRQICAGVGAAHAAGIVHRDLKPDNVFVDLAAGAPALKVLDFGIAKLKGSLSLESTRLTGTGISLGTPLYMSPEQCEGLEADERSDVYALGCVLYEMLTGRPPFVGQSLLSVLGKHVSVAPEPPSSRVPGIPPALDAAVLRALAKAPADRFATAAEFAAALAPARHGAGPSASLSDAPTVNLRPTLLETSAAGRGATSVTTPNNLPQPVTSFVGRARELATVARLLEGARLLTLVGPGGIGKTRLALEAAARALGDFPGGVWFVDLAQVVDPAFVPKAVAAVLGLPEQPGQTLLQTVSEYLCPRESLLVLDGCEHLLAGCAPLASGLLRACPGLKVLATSRETLGVSGEALARVGPLAAPAPGAGATPESLAGSEAVELFASRAALADPAFAVTPENAAPLATLCRRLDGIPLAIELAAARVSVLSVEQMLERLDDRFRLLTGGDRSAPARRQTLRATIDWSYDLLTGEERRLLARLSVFAGGWRLEAAEAVCPGRGLDESAVLDTLGRLVDKSLVLAEPLGPHVRYRLLESVRQYGLEKLRASGEEDRLRALHRGWALRLAEEGPPPGDRARLEAWCARLDAELENFRAALLWSHEESGDREATFRLCNALFPFWEERGHFAEANAWYTRVLPGADAVTPAVRADALLWAGTAAWRDGDTPRAREVLERGLEEWRALGDLKKTALALRKLGIVSEWLADYDGALCYNSESLAISRRLGDKSGVCLSLNNVAVTEIGQRRYAAAREHIEESLAIARELGQPRSVAVALHNLAEVALRLGELDRARAILEESLAVSEAAAAPYHTAVNTNLLGAVALERGDLDGADGWFRRTLEYARGADDRAMMAYGLAGFACVAALEGDHDRAVVLAGAAAAVRQAGGWSLWPAEQESIDKYVEPARLALGDRAAAADRRGRAMPLAEAVALALFRTGS